MTISDRDSDSTIPSPHLPQCTDRRPINILICIYVSMYFMNFHVYISILAYLCVCTLMYLHVFQCMCLRTYILPMYLNISEHYSVMILGGHGGFVDLHHPERVEDSPDELSNSSSHPWYIRHHCRQCDPHTHRTNT